VEASVAESSRSLILIKSESSEDQPCVVTLAVLLVGQFPLFSAYFPRLFNNSMHLPISSSRFLVCLISNGSFCFFTTNKKN
jgi:hypothetical protein